MSSPIFNALNKNKMPGNNMMQAFNQFRQSFNGDPKAQVQQLLNSGKMSQQQFNQLQGMAQQFMQMLGK